MYFRERWCVSEVSEVPACVLAVAVSGRVLHWHWLPTFTGKVGIVYTYEFSVSPSVLLLGSCIDEGI